jgi:recombination endonuclease VII
MESEKARAKRLFDNFKLTIAQWEIIYCYQNKVCWICGRPNDRAGQRLAVDHSHQDGLIRGLLCSKCNPLLGKLENAFKRLGLHKVPGLTLVAVALKIASYLQNPPAVKALGIAIYGYAGRVGTKKHRKSLKREIKAKHKMQNKDVPLTQSMGRPK